MDKSLKYYFLLPALFLIGTLYSCIDKDLGNLDNSLIFTPEYSVPVGTAEFTMGDVISSPGFDTIPADSAFWHDSLIFRYDNRYYYLPPNAIFDTTLVKDFDFNTIQNWLENATYLMFRMNMKNGLPGTVLMQVEFLDGSNNSVFSLFEYPGLEIPPAPNNSFVSAQKDTYLTPEKINALQLVRQIRIYIRLNIQNLTEGAAYYPNQFFNLQIGIRVGLEIDVNEQQN